MNKLERVDRVLRGEEVDHPPLSLWYHFGVQHAGGEQFARITLEYFRHYDFDFLKVMNDYYYPTPEGLSTVRAKADLRRFTAFEAENSDWREQFKALEIIARALEGRAYFLDTVFDPWQSLRRSVAGENMEHLAENEPEALHEALAAATENLIAYARKSLSLGAAGIFMSVPAAKEIVSRQVFLEFVKPYARRVFQAVAGQGRLNTAHIHGDDLYFDDVLDFPVNALSWWDRGPNGPSLESVKQRFAGCVMGGLDQTLFTRRSPAFLKAHVREGMALGGGRRFFLANGCSIDTWVSPAVIRAVVAAAREPQDR
ncbi:MAG: uroporphyrinogen decarboxylase family protein [Thermodesulfobacteriota bacterium]